MTPKEALELLRNASGLAILNRNDHIKVMEACTVLEKFLNDHKEEKE